MPSLIDPLKSYSQIWEIPEGLANYSDLIKNTFVSSLESFILGYADPDEATDDAWYYTTLRDQLYMLEQDPLKGDSLARMEYDRYQQDPELAMTLLCETLGFLFEEAVLLNREAIDALYAGYVIKGVTVSISPSFIVLIIRGLEA